MKILKKFMAKRSMSPGQKKPRRRKPTAPPVEITDEEKAFLAYVQDHQLTMTSPERAVDDVDGVQARG